MGSHINDASAFFEDLRRNAVGKKCLSDTGIAGDQKVISRHAVKGVREPAAPGEDFPHILPG